MIADIPTTSDTEWELHLLDPLPTLNTSLEET